MNIEIQYSLIVSLCFICANQALQLFRGSAAENDMNIGRALADHQDHMNLDVDASSMIRDDLKALRSVSFSGGIEPKTKLYIIIETLYKSVIGHLGERITPDYIENMKIHQFRDIMKAMLSKNMLLNQLKKKLGAMIVKMFKT